MVKTNVIRNNGRLSYDDCILMDFNMPIMDGVTATRLIREFLYSEGIQQPIVIGVTGHTEQEYIVEAIQNGVNIVMSKPLDGLRLRAILKKL